MTQAGRDGNLPISLELRSLHFNANTANLAASGEMLAEWFDVLGAEFPRSVWPTGYLAGRSLCASTPRHFGGGYKAVDFHPYFNLREPFTEDIDAKVADGVHKVLRYE